MVTKHTYLMKSEKVFDISESGTKKVGKKIILSDLVDIALFQRVTLVAKAIRGDEIEEVPGERRSRILLSVRAQELLGLPYGRVRLGRLK